MKRKQGERRSNHAKTWRNLGLLFTSLVKLLPCHLFLTKDLSVEDLRLCLNFFLIGDPISLKTVFKVK